jgi:aryl-alcohol dehydrogenase-like predicted oxidoreductase
LYYSLVGRGLESEWISLADYTDLGILAWSPLAGGYLTGKYRNKQNAPKGTRFAEAGQFVPIDERLGDKILKALDLVAERHETSPARIAIAWVLSRECISSVIIADRKIEHIKDNIKAVDVRLSDEDKRVLDQASNRMFPILNGWYSS